MKLPYHLVLLFCVILSLQSLTGQNGSGQNHMLFSQHLGEERIIQINVPKSYAHSDETFPALFVLDGEYIFDYAKGAVDFLSNDFGFHPEMIVVGIPNTNRNRDLFVDLKPEGSYHNFLSFLEKELLPFIAENYRVNAFKILHGWSSGSGLANYIFVKNPSLFKGYILSGAGIGPKTATLIKNELNPNAYDGIHFFVSTEGATPRRSGLQKHKALIEQIDPKGLHWYFKIYDSLTHADVLSQGLYDGLKFVFKDFHVPDSIVSKGSNATIKFYRDLEKKYGFDIAIPTGAINEICTTLRQQDKIEEALQLLDHGLEIHSNNSLLLAAMAEIHQSQNQPKLASQYYQQAMKHETDSVKANKYRVLHKNISKNF